MQRAGGIVKRLLREKHDERGGPEHGQLLAQLLAKLTKLRPNLVSLANSGELTELSKLGVNLVSLVSIWAICLKLY